MADFIGQDIFLHTRLTDEIRHALGADAGVDPRVFIEGAPRNDTFGRLRHGSLLLRALFDRMAQVLQGRAKQRFKTLQRIFASAGAAAIADDIFESFLRGAAIIAEIEKRGNDVGLQLRAAGSRDALRLGWLHGRQLIAQFNYDTLGRLASHAWDAREAHEIAGANCRE